MRYHRKVIRITAEMSPNVRYARWEIAQGRTPSGREVVPGVLSWEEYQNRRATWDKVRQTIGLDADFWEGADVLLYPPEWVSRAEQYALALEACSRAGSTDLRYAKAWTDQLTGMRPPRGRRKARGMGVDPAEGGDKSTWAVVDEYGLMLLVSLPTPDTTVVTARTIALMTQFGLPASRVCFDRGGGGKEHADRLRLQGHRVRTVAFGSAVTPPLQAGTRNLDEKKEAAEEKYQYLNIRAQMYGEFRQVLDPTGGLISEHPDLRYTTGPDGLPVRQVIGGPNGFALPYNAELRSQMGPVPLTYNSEGRLYILPKHANRPTPDGKETSRTLVGLIGHSPDELDATILAVHAMLHRDHSRVKVGALV